MLQNGSRIEIRDLFEAATNLNNANHDKANSVSALKWRALQPAGKGGRVILGAGTISKNTLLHRLYFAIKLCERVNFTRISIHQIEAAWPTCDPGNVFRKDSLKVNGEEDQRVGNFKIVWIEESIRGKWEVKESGSKIVGEDGQDEFGFRKSCYFTAFSTLLLCYSTT